MEKKIIDEKVNLMNRLQECNVQMEILLVRQRAIAECRSSLMADGNVSKETMKKVDDMEREIKNSHSTLSRAFNQHLRRFENKFLNH